MPGKSDLPSTLRRSPEKAQRTWVKTHDSAIEQYGEGRRATQTAYSALKYSFEKVGDHWEAKDGKGPSDSRAKRGAHKPGGQSHGGVDANSSKQHLYDVARELDVPGRSSMSKQQLINAIEKANQEATRKAREK